MLTLIVSKLLDGSHYGHNILGTGEMYERLPQYLGRLCFRSWSVVLRNSDSYLRCKIIQRYHTEKKEG